MNLLNRHFNYEKPDILKFREYQYDLIPEFIDLIINYLHNLGLEIDPDGYKQTIIDDVNYTKINHFACKILKVKVNSNHKEPFINLSIPKLIDSTFFRLNSVYYVPGFYIVDEPLVIKKNSSVLYSLFTPITFFTKENRAIILGNNIPLTRLLRMYYDEDMIKYLSSELQFTYHYEKLDQSIIQLADKLYCIPDIDHIKERIDLLFFDNWTKGLYEHYYNIQDANFTKVLDKLLENYALKQEKSFIDLQYKRLVFAEYLLAPLFKATSMSILSCLKGVKLYKLNVNLGDIVDHFYMKLNRFNIYDSVNGYSGLITLKATFNNPSSSGELPSTVSSIHESYKNRIDPVSISNTDPGKVINLVPDQKIDLRYGIFK